MENQRSSSRLTYLDSVRGLAALSVVFSHYNLSFGLPQGTEELLTNSPLHIWWDGFAAVSLFFVLSGFVLSIRFFGNGAQASKFHFRDYFIARVCRIWLPYVSVILSSLLAWHILKRGWPTNPAQSEWFRNLWNGQPTPLALFREAMLVLRGNHEVMPQGWTLTVELVISLFVPLIARIMSINVLWILVPEILLGTILHYPLFVIHFTLGVLLAKWYQERREWLQDRVRRRYWLYLAAGILLYTFRFSVMPHFPTLIRESRIWYFTGLGSFIILACVISSARMQAALNHPVLQFLGRTSYSVYLCHLIVMIVFTPAVISFLNAVGIASRDLAWGLGLLSTLAMTLLVSAAIEKWIERPSVVLGKALRRKSQSNSVSNESVLLNSH